MDALAVPAAQAVVSQAPGMASALLMGLGRLSLWVSSYSSRLVGVTPEAASVATLILAGMVLKEKLASTSMIVVLSVVVLSMVILR